MSTCVLGLGVNLYDFRIKLRKQIKQALHYMSLEAQTTSNYMNNCHKKKNLGLCSGVIYNIWSRTIYFSFKYFQISDFCDLFENLSCCVRDWFFPCLFIFGNHRTISITPFKRESLSVNFCCTCIFLFWHVDGGLAHYVPRLSVVYEMLYTTFVSCFYCFF